MTNKDSREGVELKFKWWPGIFFLSQMVKGDGEEEVKSTCIWRNRLRIFTIVFFSPALKLVAVSVVVAP